MLSEIRGRQGGRSDALGRRLDVRMLAATDQDLVAQARAGRFPPDLWERLGAVRIAVPPLRDRREDLPLLVERFVQGCQPWRTRAHRRDHAGALERLTSYGWPGNVAELRGRVEAMVLAAHGRRWLDLSICPTRCAARIELWPGTALRPWRRE